MDSKPFVLVELDRPRKLRFSYNIIVLAEQMLGKPLATFITGAAILGAKELRILLWAGLKEESPNLTLEQVGDLIDESPLFFNEIAAKVGEALEAALVKKKKEIREKLEIQEKNSITEN